MPPATLSHGIAERMRSGRQDLGLTQRDLASLARVSLATVQNMEAGRANPALSTLVRILDVLDHRLRVAPASTNWSCLTRVGLPLTHVEGTADQGRSPPPIEVWAPEVVRAAREVLHEEAADGEIGRLRDALCALVWAIHLHYPRTYERLWGDVPIVHRLRHVPMSGRIIKLVRMARANLADIL